LFDLYLGRASGYTINVTSGKFNELYKKLNKAQREAVDAIEGPVMVIAGPGTGKTQVLTLRLANILKKTDTPPEAILALTFTEAGVQAMRDRLRKIMGSAAHRVQIHTFHGFANTIISERPESFPRIIGSNVASDAQRLGIVKKVIENASDTMLRPAGDPEFYIWPVLEAIGDLKREAITPDHFARLIDEEEKNFYKREDLYHLKGAYKGKMKGEHQETQKAIEKNKALLSLYRAYEAEMRAAKLIDYDDLIIEVINVLEADDDVRLQIEERCQYVLADEHQDANNGQNKILELITEFHKQPNLFIVGDEKQAIFRFQGASLENFLYFTRKFPEAKVVRLTENYRSTQQILDPAHSLILASPGDASLRVPLNSNQGK
jgi:DNA helicase-2/ATP-dependent DNA helicase PcrA